MSDLQQNLFLEEPEIEKPAGGKTALPFDWFEHREDIVVERQASIAIYRHRRNHVILRAENTDIGEEDAYIHISTSQPCAP